MRLNYNQWLAIVYADIFAWPLKKEEAKMWGISDLSHLSHLGNLKTPKTKNNFCFLPGREKLVLLRQKREKWAGEKILKTEKIVSWLKKIPAVQAVFLTGSAAAGNAKKNADVDLMIVTAPNILWLTRFLVFSLLKSLKLLRSFRNKNNKICPNIFLDTNHLRITERNLYTAHEVLQAKCLFDRGGVGKKWLEENKWTAKYLPNAYKFKVKQESKSQSQYPISNIQFPNWSLVIGVHWSWLIGFLVFFEPLAFICQYLYMKPKITSERVGWGYAFFHPQDMSKAIPTKFAARLKKFPVYIME